MHLLLNHFKNVETKCSLSKFLHAFLAFLYTKFLFTTGKKNSLQRPLQIGLVCIVMHLPAIKLSEKIKHAWLARKSAALCAFVVILSLLMWCDQEKRCGFLVPQYHLRLVILCHRKTSYISAAIFRILQSHWQCWHLSVRGGTKRTLRKIIFSLLNPNWMFKQMWCKQYCLLLVFVDSSHFISRNRAGLLSVYFIPWWLQHEFKI